MAKKVARSWADTSSEHASAGACSASCYDTGKDVRILSVIVPIRKLRQIQRQIGFADLMERPHNATLQEAPKAVQVRRMNVAPHVLTFGVIDRLMRKLALQATITDIFIRRDQRDILTHGLP